MVDPDESARAHAALQLHPVYDVLGVSTLKEAHERLTQQGERAIRFVLLELNTPDGDGLWLIRHLSTEAELPVGMRPMIICLTARKSVKDKVDALLAGASDYVVKPATHVALALRLQLLERFERLQRTGLTCKPKEVRPMDMRSPFLVLVVDDNPELLRSVRFALEALGNYKVETALDGVEGLQRAVDMRPNCIIIDVKMPGINGNQLVTVLRGDPDTADIPLIILSALVQDDDILRGHIAGVDQYLSKPFIVTDLIAAIERVTQMTPQDRAARLQRLLDGESDDHN